MTALTNIRAKVRKLTARNSQNDISDAEIDNYINTYYQYDLPESLRLLELRDVWSFPCVGNVEVYPFPRNDFLTVEPPAYVGGQQVDFFNNDRDMFYRTWPKTNYIQQIGLGDGTNGPYGGQLTGTPFLPSIGVVPNNNNPMDADYNVLFSAQLNSNTSTTGSATSAYDDGEGGFVDATTFAPLANSAISYLSGDFVIYFTDPVPQNNPIYASYIPYTAGQPRSLMIAQEQIYLRPIPDKAYMVDITVERKPTALMGDDSTPENYEWWQLLAFGAAAKILEDNADWEQRDAIQPYFTQQLLLMQRRTLNQLTTSRTATLYEQGGMFPGGNLYPYL